MELEELRLGMRGAMAAQLQAAQTAHEEVQMTARLGFGKFWRPCSNLDCMPPFSSADPCIGT